MNTVQLKFKYAFVASIVFSVSSCVEAVEAELSASDSILKLEEEIPLEIIYSDPNERAYNFLNELILQEYMNKNFGLDLDFEVFTQIEIEMLEKGAKKSSTIMTDTISDYRSVNEKPKYLSKQQVNHFIEEHEATLSRKIAPARLELNLNNREMWYSLSYPLFSVTGDTVLIKISELCPGLCGTGERSIFIKEEKGRWSKEILDWWIY